MYSLTGVHAPRQNSFHTTSAHSHTINAHWLQEWCQHTHTVSLRSWALSQLEWLHLHDCIWTIWLLWTCPNIWSKEYINVLSNLVTTSHLQGDQSHPRGLTTQRGCDKLYTQFIFNATFHPPPTTGNWSQTVPFSESHLCLTRVCKREGCLCYACNVIQELMSQTWWDG